MHEKYNYHKNDASFQGTRHYMKMMTTTYPSDAKTLPSFLPRQFLVVTGLH